MWAALDPQICPSNSDLTAYASGGDLWVTHAISGHSERLTYAHDSQRTFAEDPLSAGLPSYVMQEEFNRYQGFWWQPKSEGIRKKNRSKNLPFIKQKKIVCFRWRVSNSLRRGR